MCRICMMYDVRQRQDENGDDYSLLSFFWLAAAGIPSFPSARVHENVVSLFFFVLPIIPVPSPPPQDKLLQRLEEHKHEVAASPGEECVICISAKATMQTFPCAHRVVCRKCFVKTIQVAVSQRMLPLRCVVCRAKILRLNVSGSKTAASSESTMTATTAEAPNGTGSQTPSSSSSSSSADRKEMQSSSRSQRGKHRTRATQRVTPVTAANVRGSAAGILLSRSSESFLRSIDEQDELKELLPLAAAADRCPPLPGHTTCHSSASCRTPSVSFIISGHDGGSKIIGRNDAAEEEEDFRSLVSSSSTRSSMEAIHKPNSARSSTSSCCSTDFQSSSPKANFSLPFLTGFCRRRLQRVRDRISKHKWDPIY